MTKLVAGLLLLICGCSSSPSTAVPSPSGSLVGSADVLNDLVRIRITIVNNNSSLSFQTRASDFQKWAWGWSVNDVFVLYSSDIGTYAYEIKGGAIVEREANEDEQEVGRIAYEKRYGKRPRVKP